MTGKMILDNICRMDLGVRGSEREEVRRESWTGKVEGNSWRIEVRMDLRSSKRT